MERVTGAGLRGVEISDDLKQAMERRASVVTGNERAARGLRRAYDALLLADGNDRWEPAKVMSWSAWTVSLWREMLLEGRSRSMLLNSFQEHAVWQHIVASEEGSSGLSGADGLAEMAAGTWTRLCAYTGKDRTGNGRRPVVSDLLRQQDDSADVAAFARWAKSFEQRCEEEDLVSPANLDARLGEALRSGELSLAAKEILLVGFDQITPAREGLLEAMRSTGITVSVAKGDVTPKARYITAAVDEAEELRACARWAAGRVARDDCERVAVIVPDLGAERAGIERVFREVLAPELESIAADESRSPYEFSLGRVLGEMPLIAVALDLLRWALGALPIDHVSTLLVSGYFAASQLEVGGERNERAEFDASELRRRKMLRPEISLAEMARWIVGSKRSTKLHGLLAAVRRMERLAVEFGGIAQSYGEWAQRMRELLAGAGWGASGAETSEEFQLRERWEEALDAMSTLDFRGGSVEYAGAVDAVERIAMKTTFAPESRSAPVQVMGPLEAAGSEFDAVWFLRGGELSWPALTGTLPLVRWDLQRDLGMPGTNMERDLEVAKQTMERICSSGREVVVVSYAQSSGEASQRPAAIVRGMGLAEVAIERLAGTEPERVVVAMERVEDAAPIRPLRDGAVRGGVRVLELQAACGFRAFAEQRLFSKDLESRTLGLNALEGGNIVHRALESFWTEVKDQATLVGMTAQGRSEAVSRAADEGLRSCRPTLASAWDESYLEMQRDRLRRLIEGWLKVEMNRPSFKVVRQEESLQDVRLGPLCFKLRVDRVDLVDGAQILIDYKTGAAKTGDWVGDRPDAPQLPLYAVLVAGGGAEPLPLEGAIGEEGRPRELGGVAFGNVRAGEGARLQGFAAREGLLPGKLARMEAGTFGQQVDRWREVLEGLAEEFASGDARVRPKNYPETCLRCGQRMLCRLDASLLDEIEAEDDVRDGDDG